MKAIAVEESGAEELLRSPEVPIEFWSHEPSSLTSLRLKLVTVDDTFFVLGPKATEASPLTVFPLRSDGYFAGIQEELRDIVLRRCLRAAATIRTPGRHLDRSWAPYHDSRGYVIFYSTTVAMGNVRRSARSIVRIRSSDVLVAGYVDGEKPFDLAEFREPDETRLVLDAAREALPNAIKLQPPVGRSSLTDEGFELSALTSHIDPTHGRTYEEWVQISC